jgi:methylmalonyl-CoA mutase
LYNNFALNFILQAICISETDYMSTLFDEFKAADYQDWLARTLRELKGKNPEVLQASGYEGFSTEAYSDASHLPSPDFLKALQNLPKHPKDAWENRMLLPVESLANARALAQEALATGCDSVVFDVRNFQGALSYAALVEGFDSSRIGIIFNEAAHIEEVAALPLYYSAFSILAEGLRQKDSSAAFALLSQYLHKSQHPIRLVIQGQGFQNAGGNTVQELAFSLTLAIEFLHRLSEQGHSLASLLPHIEISLAVGNHYFMEIAKFRALRYLWQNLVEGFLPGQAPQPLRVHAHTCTWNKSQSDAYNNILRSSTEAMSAIIGGCDALSIAPYNATFESPNAFAWRIARNISLLLKEEAYLGDIEDAAAGSYTIERLTAKLCEESWALLQKVEGQGGFLAAWQAGFIKQEIAQVAAQKAADFQAGKLVLVGSNKYLPQGDAPQHRPFAVAYLEDWL